ncbi:S8 family serine peptidase [Streptomyces sp. NBC_00669]|uniref:S8 family peptidase n=1 Tax=Streptomyces sp. NBC_00669 TaxID=2976011 RepID=UPI002E2F4FDE|nr:S8 family serine peptidase [Streptomyces sp. NBC_00669]
MASEPGEAGGPPHGTTPGKPPAGVPEAVREGAREGVREGAADASPAELSAPARVVARQRIRFAHASVGGALDAGRVAAAQPVERGWAWGGATGRGVRVCVIDSGVDSSHPAIGGSAESYVAEPDTPAPGARWDVVPDTAGDLAGHGTACAGIIRSLAPECELTSVRILGSGLRGSGEALVRALEWAVERRFAVVNVSLSTRREEHKERLHDLADAAYFAGVTLVSAAHNSPVDSYPWRFPSVLSVGAHAEPDPEYVEANPDPPVDLFARGVAVEAPWPGGGKRVVSGNSFAAPHVTGLCARILERHPRFRTPELRHVLTATAGNLRRSQG